MSDPYNPLSKPNLARSIEGEILGRPLQPLEDLKSFQGAGIYALYYRGALEIYGSLSQSLNTKNPTPVYVGKAIPEGGRIGGITVGEVKTTALFKRLRKHGRSIAAAENLHIADFLVRFLVVDDVWIPLGENMLIESYKPVWNLVVAGFGNNPLGKGRKDQKPSLWDILHPGRILNVMKSPDLPTQERMIDRVLAYFAGEPVPIAIEIDESEEAE